MSGNKNAEHTPYPGGPIAIGYLFGDKRPLNQLSDEFLAEVAAWCIEELLRRGRWSGTIPKATMEWARDTLKRRHKAQNGGKS